MRVIYVTSSLPNGKGEAFVVPEIQELRRLGHEVLIAPMYPRGRVLHGDVEPLLEHAVVRPLLSPEIAAAAARELWRAPGKALRPLSWLSKSRSLKILLKNLAVYPKGLWLAGLARAWAADHVHVHWAATSATMALVASGLSGVPWSITAHRFDIVENNLLDIKAEKARFVRAINQRGARELRQYIKPETPEPFVLHMGIALPSLAECSSASRKRHFRMVTSANLLEVKGHAYLLEAVGILRDRGLPVTLDLAGAGPLRRELEGRVEGLGLQEQVHFLGAVPHQKLLARLSAGAWDMLVLPSIITAAGEKEGIPVAVIEAMGCRVPVVSTNTGGIPELFEGVTDPPLVPPGDPEALADGIELQIHDPGLRGRLVEEGRRRVEESFAIEQVMNELVSRFGGCASSGAQRRESS